MSTTPRPTPPGRPSPLELTPEDVSARLDGLEDLPLDLQVRTLAGVEADLRAALDASRD